MERPKRILSYSSLAEEKKRQRKQEEERREALELYNESTFGERRPITFAFLRVGVMLALVSIEIWLFPRIVGLALVLLTVVSYGVYKARSGR